MTAAIRDPVKLMENLPSLLPYLDPQHSLDFCREFVRTEYIRVRTRAKEDINKGLALLTVDPSIRSAIYDGVEIRFNKLIEFLPFINVHESPIDSLPRYEGMTQEGVSMYNALYYEFYINSIIDYCRDREDLIINLDNSIRSFGTDPITNPLSLFRLIILFGELQFESSKSS